MYEVIVAFSDAKDNNRTYLKGDKYPRDGYKPDDERIEFLMSDKTALGVPVIAKKAEENDVKVKRTYTSRRRKENE